MHSQLHILSPPTGLAHHDSLPVVDLDLATDGSSLPATKAAYILAWWHHVPVSAVVVQAEQPLDSLQVHSELRRHLAPELSRARLHHAAAPQPWTRIGYSVAVCTADRPDSLDRCLRSLAKLDGQYDEVVVVDNSKHSTDEVARVVAAHGYRYLREPAPGLDRARNRALVAVESEVVLFTDDDVEIEPGWDRWLLDGFADPLVMATAGLVVPASLAVRAHVQSEQFCSHSRGFAPLIHGRRHRYPDFEPAGKPATPGVGAAMAVRRRYALAVGGFPAELDAGTPTGTGGDTWMYRSVLERGYRVAYEPRSVARHWHRTDHAALATMLESNASGVWALHWRRLAHGPRRHSILSSAAHTLGWHGQNLGRIVRGGSDALPVPLFLAELKGVVRSPLAYRRSWLQARHHPNPPMAEAFPAPWIEQFTFTEPSSEVATDHRTPSPSVSVVIPTRGRQPWVTELVDRLLDDPSVDEIVVAVDGDIDGTVAALRERATGGDDDRLRWVELVPTSTAEDHGSGAGAARNAAVAVASGDVILFLDDDVLPHHPNLVEQHLAVHRRRSDPVIVVGPALVDRRLEGRSGAQQGRNWWIDQTTRLLSEPNLGFTDICTGNLSMERTLFEQLGRFAPIARREDWLLGLRAEAAGIPLVAAPGAAVIQRDGSRSVERFDKRRDGAGDAVILAEFPHYRRYLSPDLVGPGGRAGRLARLAGRHPDRYARIEPLIHQIANRLPANSLLRAKLGRLQAMAGYWVGASTPFGPDNNPLFADAAPADDPARNSTGEHPVLELSAAATPPEAGTGRPVAVTWQDEPLGLESSYGNGQAYPAWVFRRCLVDRFAGDVAAADRGRR